MDFTATKHNLSFEKTGSDSMIWRKYIGEQGTFQGGECTLGVRFGSKAPFAENLTKSGMFMRKTCPSERGKGFGSQKKHNSSVQDTPKTEGRKGLKEAGRRVY